MEAGFEYLAYGPAQGVPEKLIILLHGYGRNGLYMEKMARLAQYAVPQAMILSPHGVEALDTAAIEDKSTDHFLHVPQELQDEAQRGDRLLRQWFHIDGRLDRLVPRVHQAAGTINRLIDWQRDILGLANKDIVVMGFSQGAGLALYTAFSREEEIAGMICHSAIAFQDLKRDPFLRSKPESLYIYGDEDREFTPQRYHDTFLWLQDYTENRATEKIMAGLGHSTNSESRQECAAFMRRVLA